MFKGHTNGQTNKHTDRQTTLILNSEVIMHPAKKMMCRSVL